MALVPKKPFVTRFRFGLRTLFALITALCLCLGFVVHRAESQRRAVQAIEAMGGSVTYRDDWSVRGNVILRLQRMRSHERADRYTRHYFHAVTVVDLSQTSCTDEALMLLASLPSVELLRLDYTNITDEGIRLLRSLSKLRSLSLENTQITDAGLAYLTDARKLDTILLSHTLVTDSGMECIKGLPCLERVFIRRTKVTQAGADALTSANPALVKQIIR